MGPSGGHKAPQIKERENSEERDYLLQVTFHKGGGGGCSWKTEAEKREKDSERLRHIILLSLLVRAGPIHAQLWMARACSDCTTGPRYLHSEIPQDWIPPDAIRAGLCGSNSKKGTLPHRLLSHLMARVYIGFHQHSHYPTAESALADRCNACRMPPFAPPPKPSKAWCAGQCSVWRGEEKHAAYGVSRSNLLPGWHLKHRADTKSLLQGLRMC